MGGAPPILPETSTAPYTILHICARVALLPGLNSRHPTPQPYPDMMPLSYAVSTYRKNTEPTPTSRKVAIGGSSSGQPAASTTILAICPLVTLLPGRNSRQLAPQSYPDTRPAW